VVAVKKSYFKTIFREVRQSFSRFLAIFSIVALGVGFLAGLMATTPDMRISADRYYDESNMMDLRVVSTLGISEEDVRAVRAIDGIAEVMPVYTTDQLVSRQGEDAVVARIHSLPQDREGDGYLNRVTVLEGRLPESKGECVVEKEKMDTSPLQVGDLIKVTDENTNVEDTLSDTEYTVVGIVQSSYYFSFEREQSSIGNGKIGLILYVDASNFALNVYTDLFVTVQDAKESDAFSSEYDDLIDPIAKKLESLGEVQSPKRYEQVKKESTEKLMDARAEFAEQKQEANNQLEDARKKLEEARKEIEEHEQTLLKGKQELTQGESAIAENEKKLAEGELQYAQGQKQLAFNEEKLSDGEKQLIAGERQLLEGERALKANRIKYEQELAEKGEQIDDGKTQIQDGKEQLGEAKKQLDEAKKLIDTAHSVISWLQENSMPDLADWVANYLDPKETEYNDGVAEYERQLALLLEKEQELAAGEEAWQQGKLTAEQAFAKAEQELEDAKDQILATKEQLADARLQLAAARIQLAESRLQLDQGKQELDAAKTKLEEARLQATDGEAQLEQAKEQLDEGQAEYDKNALEAEQKFADAEKELSDAQVEIDNLEVPQWYVLNRHMNVGFASFDSNAEKVESIAKVFPLFFFLVAALVALTTMTRMVEEERTQIGTMKALGYSKTAIALKYLLYAGAASIAGSVFGLLVGFQVFPTVIWGAYEIMYNLPPLVTVFHWNYALFASLAAVLCTLIATISACYSVLKECPARLMLPRAPKAGKRVFLEYITPIWSRLKFTHKVTARNLIRYKKRFFMTVIGIAGCTALLLTGFGLRDSISDIVGKQYGDICHYNMIVSMKEENALADEDTQQILGDSTLVEGYLPIHQETTDIILGDTTKSAYLYIPQDPSQLEDYISLRERKSGNPLMLTDESVILTEKLAETLGVNIGDRITLKDSEGDTAEVAVGGITENYVYGYIYMTPSLYASSFNKEPFYSQLIATLSNNALERRDEISTRLLNHDQINAVQFTTDLSNSFSDIIKNIDYIVIVLIISAGALAFVVLYNLTNINITERQKEIATLKVLGFFDKEVSAYIYRETAILSLIGTAVGLLLGIVLHGFVVKTAEVDMVMFGRTITWLSYLLAAALTLVFSALVNLVMFRKLRNISMVESMKSGE
jgi:putative ABC transport system permease protein